MENDEITIKPEHQDLADDILTMEEARAILRIGRNTMLKALQDGEVPGVQVGRQWRISKKALQDFMAGQKKEG